jgi:hypothetical protein
MKAKLALWAVAVLLAGCTPFNTVLLHRNQTGIDAFMGDRAVCINEARKCIVERYANSSYHGETVEHLYPSRGVYLGCMRARGYAPVQVNGFYPLVLVKMEDYPPGRDCYGG